MVKTFTASPGFKPRDAVPVSSEVALVDGTGAGEKCGEGRKEWTREKVGRSLTRNIGRSRGESGEGHLRGDEEREE